MKTVTIHKAKTNLSRLIAEVCSGEEIIISRGSEPVAKIVSIAKISNATPQKPGALKGKFKIGTDSLKPALHEETGPFAPKPKPKPKPKSREDFAIWRGKIQIGPEFFDPLPDDELAAFNE